MNSQEDHSRWYEWARRHGVVTPAYKSDGSWSMDLDDYQEWSDFVREGANAGEISANSLNFGSTEWRYYVAPADNVGMLRAAAAFRERITLALEAEIGDRDAAERLAGVVVRALEGGE
jgi:hypothetical protein